MSTSLELHQGSAPVEINYEAILAHLKLNPRDPQAQALLVVCDRYGLDPILKHAVLIQGTLYVTRDGLLSVAHRSGQFDGIEVVDEGETASHFTAKVSVYRKDMGRPFTYTGRYPKNGGNRTHGPEMAIKCAEVMSLRRAFNVTGIPAREEAWGLDADSAKEPLAIDAASAPVANAYSASDAKVRLMNAIRAAGWEYVDKDKTCPAAVEAVRIWDGRSDETLTDDDLRELLGQVSEPIAEAEIVEPEPEPAAAETTEGAHLAAPESSPAPTAKAERAKRSPAQQLHATLGKLGFQTDERCEFIYCASKGRTTKAGECTQEEIDAAYWLGKDVAEGRRTLEEVVKANDAVRSPAPAEVGPEGDPF